VSTRGIAGLEVASGLEALSWWRTTPRRNLWARRQSARSEVAGQGCRLLARGNELAGRTAPCLLSAPVRPTTAPEAVLRSICRRLRAEGARVSVFIASETNGIAVGHWPGVCDDIGLVLVGDEDYVQVQADEHVEHVPLDVADLADEVMATLRRADASGACGDAEKRARPARLRGADVLSGSPHMSIPPTAPTHDCSVYR